MTGNIIRIKIKKKINDGGGGGWVGWPSDS